MLATKKRQNSILTVTLCVNPAVAIRFSTQRGSNAGNVSMSWSRHERIRKFYHEKHDCTTGKIRISKIKFELNLGFKYQTAKYTLRLRSDYGKNMWPNKCFRTSNISSLEILICELPVTTIIPALTYLDTGNSNVTIVNVFDHASKIVEILK